MALSEVRSVLSWIPPKSDRYLMVGVLVSDKTLHGLGNNHPRRFPKIENVERLFLPDPKALNLIHFNTHEQESLLDQMVLARLKAGDNFHGFQLNVAWPKVKTLQLYRREHEDAIIVLQLGAEAMDVVGHRPDVLANRLRFYEPYIDYVLVDPSSGVGRAFNQEKSIEQLVAIRDACPELGLGLAGGLGPDTIEAIAPVAKVFPAISIDAEGRLRDEKDNLDPVKARGYIMGAMQVFWQATAI